MSNKPNTQLTYQQILSAMFHDFGGILGNLGGYTHLFDQMVNNDLDKIDVVDLLNSAKSYYESWKPTIESLSEFAQSNLDRSDSEHQSLISDLKQMRASAMIWFDLLTDLAADYDEVGELNTQMINQMNKQVEMLASFRNKLAQARNK